MMGPDEARFDALGLVIAERDAARRAAEAFAVWLDPDTRSKVVSVAIEHADDQTKREIADALTIADARIESAAVELRREGKIP